jgi:hypothetical protein
MDARTRAATYQDVQRVARLLEDEHVEYALIGGYALALQGIVRLTEDVDILVEPTVDNARRWGASPARISCAATWPHATATRRAARTSLFEPAAVENRATR